MPVKNMICTRDLARNRQLCASSFFVLLRAKNGILGSKGCPQPGFWQDSTIILDKSAILCGNNSFTL